MPTDINFLKMTIRNTLNEIATQAQQLAAGLQNIVPPQELAKPVNSVSYLLETAEHLKKVIQVIEEPDHQ